MSLYSNRYLILPVGLLAVIGAACKAPAELPELDRTQRDWLASQIFRNECSSDYQCLTSWNLGEDFPSLGIGHFIWYRPGQSEPFVESFPDLLQAYEERKIALPGWLEAVADHGAPWQDRQQFLTESGSAEMEQLRRLLAATMPVQIDLIIQRLYDSLPKLLANLPDQQQRLIRTRFYQVANSQPPFGIYALVDYVNFKGEGVVYSERYQEQGWGLLQVLESMPDLTGSESVLKSFVETASSVLARRVDNAPPQRNEHRWLQGWNNRLQTYLPK